MDTSVSDKFIVALEKELRTIISSAIQTRGGAKEKTPVPSPVSGGKKAPCDTKYPK